MGADLPSKHGGLGIVTQTAARCRLRCIESRYCKHWVHVDGWRVNCYLKSDKVTPERKEGATAGSIGVRCMSGGEKGETEKHTVHKGRKAKDWNDFN